MTNDEVIQALEQVKTYCSSSLIDPLDYAIHVFRRFERAGVEDPVHADYSKLAPTQEEEEK